MSYLIYYFKLFDWEKKLITSNFNLTWLKRNKKATNSHPNSYTHWTLALQSLERSLWIRSVQVWVRFNFYHLIVLILSFCFWIFILHTLWLQSIFEKVKNFDQFVVFMKQLTYWSKEYINLICFCGFPIFFSSVIDILSCINGIISSDRLVSHNSNFHTRNITLSKG